MTAAMHEPLRGRASDMPIILFAAIVFCVVSAWMAVASEGFLEADGVTHHLARRFAFDEPLHFVGVWTRPLCVLLYAIPAQFGLVATRLTSLALVMLLLCVTLGVNRRQSFASPALVALFLLTQPVLFAHSFAELTEIPFALLMICGFWAYQQKQFGLLAIIAAVSPLARPEGFGLIFVTTIALTMHRRWWWITVLPVGLLVWSYVGWHVHGRPVEYPWYRWLIANWPYSGESVYGRGSAFRFLLILPGIVGPMAFPLVWIGARQAVVGDAGVALAHRVRRFMHDHDYRCGVLIAVIPLGILFGHTLLWLLGKMASSGEPRYMLIAAPFWALLAAAGWEWVCGRLRITRPARWLVIAAIVPVIANIARPMFPLAPTDDARLARLATTWIRERPEVLRDYPRLAAASPYVFLDFDLDRLDPDRVVDFSFRTVADSPPGVLLVWDSYFGDANSSAALVVTEESLAAHGWRPLVRLGLPDSSKHATIYASPHR